MRDSKRFIALAAITQPHGVHGRVKLKLFAESVESFTELLPHLQLEDGTPIRVALKAEAGGAPVAEIAAIKNREQAQLWRGKLLGVPRDAMPQAEDGEYYIEDLVGITLTTEDGAAYGHIRSVENYGGGDIVVIARTNGEETMLALTDSHFPHIDSARGTATVRPAEIIIAREENANEHTNHD